MKKRYLLVGTLIFGVAALTACSNNSASTPTSTSESTHEHTYATEWSKNETKHWHESTCGHDVKKGEADHTWNDGVETTSGTKFTCTVCGYEKTETSKYQVSETKWKEILNNTFNYTMEETVTQGSNSMQQNFYFTENGMLKDVVDGSKVAYTKENDKYYVYQFSNSGWTKEETTGDIYNDNRGNSFIVFVNEYSKFTYNLETKKYTLDSLDISDFASHSSDYSTFATNISIGFEDEKLSSLNFTMTMNSPTYSLSAQIVCKNFGTTTITIPTIHEHTYANEWSKNETKHWHESTCGHDVKKDEADHTFDKGVVDGNNMKYSCTVCGYSYTVDRYEVTKHGWDDAFDNSKMTNYTAVVDSGNGQTITYKHCVSDDKIIVCIAYDDSSFYPDTYYIKTGSIVTGYQQGNDGNWVKSEMSLSDMTDQYREAIEWIFSYTMACPNFSEFYDKFTYSSNSLSYNFVGEENSNEIKTNSIMEMMDSRYYKAEVKIEDGKLKQVKAYMSGQTNPLNTITFSDYGTTTINLPNVD